MFLRKIPDVLNVSRISWLNENQTSQLFRGVLIEYIQGRIIPLLWDIGRPEMVQKNTVDQIRERIVVVVDELIARSTLTYDDKKEMLLTLAEKHRFNSKERPRIVFIEVIQAVLRRLGIDWVRSKAGWKRELLLSPKKH